MTRTVILAAGEGTRLRPLTDHQPKTLVPLAGRSLLDRQMSVLQRAGITDISIVVGYCAQALANRGARTFLNPLYASTNMVASLLCAKALFDGGDEVVVAYGDIAYEPRVLARLLAIEAPLAVVVDEGWHDLWQLRMDNPLSDAETMKLDAAGNIIELGCKPRSLADIEGQYIGLFKVGRGFASHFFDRFEQWPADQAFDGRPRDSMYMTSYLQHQIDCGTPVRAAIVQHGWLEIDSVEDLRRYEAAVADGRLRVLYDGAA